MPHFEVSLDEFLETANEAVLSQKKSVNELLAKAERVLTKKLKTRGDCEDYLQLINAEGRKFNDCLKVLASHRTKYDNEKISKKDFDETTRNAVTLLKKNCQHLQVKLGNIVSDTKAVTTKDIEDFKQFLTGLKKIVNNRLKYLSSMPASESVFNDEDNFSKHWIFAKEGDGSEDIEMDDPLSKDDDDDDKKSKKSKKESDSDDEECKGKDCKKSKKKDDDDDEDDSESGFSDGEDPEDEDSKKSKKDDDEECDDDDEDCKKKKSKKKDDDDDEDDEGDDKKSKKSKKESDSDDDDDSEEESESIESTLFNTVLQNFVKNTADFGKEVATEQFFTDCEYLSNLDPSSKDEMRAKEAATMMLANRRNNEEVTMESISIVSALMDNYVYNINNFGVDAANEQLAADVSYHEAEAMEASVGRNAEKIYRAGDTAGRLDNKIDKIRQTAYTRKDLKRADKLTDLTRDIKISANVTRNGKELEPNSELFVSGRETGQSKYMPDSYKRKAAKSAKAGATAAELDKRAEDARNSGLIRKADRYKKVASAIQSKYHDTPLEAFNKTRLSRDISKVDAYKTGYNYADNNGAPYKRFTKESALIDDLCDKIIYDAANFGLESAIAQFDNILDEVDMPELEEMAMEATISDAPTYNGNAVTVGGAAFNTPGKYNMTSQRYSTGDWVSNAIDARLSNDARVARDTMSSINKSDAKKMAAIANKMVKIKDQKKNASGNDKKCSKCDAKLRKLKLSADAINETRKTMGMNPLSFESALAAYDASDPTIAAYENVLDEIISRVDDYDFDEAMEGSDKFIMSPGKYNINKSTSSDLTDYNREGRWLTTAIAKRVNPDNLQGRLDYKYAEKVDAKDIKKMAAAAKKIEKLKIKMAKETNPKKIAQIKVQIKKLGVVASSINNARKKAGLDPIAFESALSANVNVFEETYRAYDDALEMLICAEDDLTAEFCDLDYED